MDDGRLEKIFAPWRYSWVNRESNDPDDEECIFCEFSSPNEGSESDRHHRIVARSEHAYSILNHSPYNPGHLMVIPVQHIDRYTTLDRPRLVDHSLLVQHSLRALDAAFSPDGFNVGMNVGKGGGASIRDHIHTHIVPRWTGDTNFMPTTGGTKVIVQSLDDSYSLLHDTFESMFPVEGQGPDKAVWIDNPVDE